MENIEVKAKCLNLERAEHTAERLAAKFECSIHQRDTYFTIKKGRLKLRQISTGISQLIFYNRPNEAGPKTSEYHIYPVESPSQLKQMLGAALGIWKIVEKERRVYLFEEVRIHLDRVKNLGSFLEFEGVISPGADRDNIREKVDWLVSQFEIRNDDLLEGSYSDLID